MYRSYARYYVQEKRFTDDGESYFIDGETLLGSSFSVRSEAARIVSESAIKAIVKVYFPRETIKPRMQRLRPEKALRETTESCRSIEEAEWLEYFFVCLR